MRHPDRSRRKPTEAASGAEVVALGGAWECRGQIGFMRHEGTGGPVLDSLGLQLQEAREVYPRNGKHTVDGYDQHGRSKPERRAWRLFLGGWCLLLALLGGLLDASAQAVDLASPSSPGLTPTLACVEPTTDEGGRPLGTVVGGRSNGLLGCFAAVQVGSVNVWESWLKPDSERGGKRHELGDALPTYTGSYPVTVACVCYGRAGGTPQWGKPAKGRVSIYLTLIP